jgi:hypothetical protein
VNCEVVTGIRAMSHEQQKLDILYTLISSRYTALSQFDQLHRTVQSAAIIMRLLLSVVICLCVLPGHVVGQLNLGGNMGGFHDLLAGLSNQNKDGTCPSACDDQPRLLPAPKKRIRPYSNGCSVPPSMRDSIGDYTHFTSCCDLHDTCYASCGIEKKRCESDFGKCMKRICQTKHESSSSEKFKKCNGMADMFTMGTSMFGCGGYTELQKDTCDCLEPKEAEQRVHEYATEFYKAYNQTHPLPDKFVEKYISPPDDNKSVSREKRRQSFGMALYVLYRKYPQSIDVITRDGQSGRAEPAYFELPKIHSSYSLDGEM